MPKASGRSGKRPRADGPEAARVAGFPDLPAAAALYLGLALVYFLPALLPGRHIFGSDYFAASYFYHEWISAEFARGAIPKWLPYVYGGLPWFANPGMTWYPFRFLADWLLPVSRIFTAVYVIQIGVAGIGGYLLSRELGARRWIAFLAGLAFQFTGVLTSLVLAGHDGRMIVISYAPLFLYFLHAGIRTGAVAWFVGAGTTIGFAMLSFQIQSAYYLLLAGGLWGVFLLIRMGWHRRPAGMARRIALGLGAVALGFALGSVNFLPFLGYVEASPRAGEGGRGYEYATQWSLDPPEVLGLAVPEQAGIRGDYRADSPGANPFKLHTEYAGALVMVLLVMGALFSRRDPRWWFFAGLSIFALTLAFGRHTPIYRLYYELLPGTARFRTPDMAFYLVPLSLMAMAALTLERLAAMRESAPRLRGGRRRGATPGRAGGREDSPARAAGIATLAMVAAAVLGSFTLGGTEYAGASAPVGWLRFALFAGLSGGAIWLWLRGGLEARLLVPVLALVVIADQWLIGKKFFETTGTPSITFAPDDVANFLRSQPEPFRVWVAGPPFLRAYHNHDNYLMRFGIEQASGEHGNQLQRYNQYLGAGEEVYVDYHAFWEDVERAARTGEPTRYVGAGNIRYIVAMAELPIPGWSLVHAGPSALIYENPAATPRAFLVGEARSAGSDEAVLEIMREPGWDPLTTAVLTDSLPAALPGGVIRGEAGISHYEQDRVVVRASNDRPALLVLADNWYPGWQARMNGRDLPVLRVNHTFRGVLLPAGEHEVEFRFRPARLYAGLYIYLTMLALIAAFAGWLAWRRWGRRSTASPAGGI